MKKICFDMDGTIADLYSVDNWLPKLIAENEEPYIKAKPLVNMNVLSRRLNSLQRKGYSITIISWLSKDSTEEFDKKVTQAKKLWLQKHLKSVKFDEINIVKYGTCKAYYGNNESILFDDELRNRTEWNGIAYDVNNILETLKGLEKAL